VAILKGPLSPHLAVARVILPFLAAALVEPAGILLEFLPAATALASPFIYVM
jgi:hypothetical protein